MVGGEGGAERDLFEGDVVVFGCASLSQAADRDGGKDTLDDSPCDVWSDGCFGCGKRVLGPCVERLEHDPPLHSVLLRLCALVVVPQVPLKHQCLPIVHIGPFTKFHETRVCVAKQPQPQQQQPATTSTMTTTFDLRLLHHHPPSIVN